MCITDFGACLFTILRKLFAFKGWWKVSRNIDAIICRAFLIYGPLFSRAKYIYIFLINKHTWRNTAHKERWCICAFGDIRKFLWSIYLSLIYTWGNRELYGPHVNVGCKKKKELWQTCVHVYSFVPLCGKEYIWGVIWIRVSLKAEDKFSSITYCILKAGPRQLIAWSSIIQIPLFLDVLLA